MGSKCQPNGTGSAFQRPVKARFPRCGAWFGLVWFGLVCSFACARWPSLGRLALCVAQGCNVISSVIAQLFRFAQVTGGVSQPPGTCAGLCL